MELSLHISPSIVQNIGTVKIMKVDAKRTFDEFPESFVSLDNEYCSLGIDEAYYNNLKEHLGNQYQSVLLALRDAAIFPGLQKNLKMMKLLKRLLYAIMNRNKF